MGLEIKIENEKFCLYEDGSKIVDYSYSDAREWAFGDNGFEDFYFISDKNPEFVDEFKYHIEVMHSSSHKKLLDLNESQIPAGLIFYSRMSDSCQFKKSVVTGKTEVSFEPVFDVIHWAENFSIVDFLYALEKEASCEIYEIELLLYSDQLSKSGFIIKTIAEHEEKISSVLARLKDHAMQMQDLVIEKMRRDVQDQLIVKIFNFPEQYRNICTQYLVWFGEFLQQLGIKADIHSEQNGSQTKLIILPENANQMLFEVENLFYRYLSLPYSEILPANSNSVTDLALVNSLQFQINSLQTQLQMKDSIIQLKDATIGSLNSSLTASHEKLMVSSLQEKEKEKEDRISLLGGAVNIGDIRVNAITINPAKIVEKAKSTLKSIF